MNPSRPPVPGPVGGKLIRQALALLDRFGVERGDQSGPHWICACSGGIDSSALAVLLAKYGRRIVARERLRLLHVNHQWRGEQSFADEQRVRALGESLGIPVDVERVDPPKAGAGESWEDDARRKRQAVFVRARGASPGAWIVTGHQSEDLAETLLWRLFTGTAESHGGGIAVAGEGLLRPLLTSRRSELQAFLEEEGLKAMEDETNSDPRFLRARMRAELMPRIEEIFPRAIPHLVEQALRAQERLGAAPEAVEEASMESLWSAIFGATGLQARRSHWELLGQKWSEQNWTGTLQLPGGWSLARGRAAQEGESPVWTIIRGDSGAR